MKLLAIIIGVLFSCDAHSSTICRINISGGKTLKFSDFNEEILASRFDIPRFRSEIYRKNCKPGDILIGTVPLVFIGRSIAEYSDRFTGEFCSSQSDIEKMGNIFQCIYSEATKSEAAGMPRQGKVAGEADPEQSAAR